MSTMNPMVIVPEVKAENILMRVRISQVGSDGLKAKQAMIQRYADLGWGDEELAAMFGLSKFWVGALRNDRQYFFYCGACGAQVASKKAECRVCN